MLLSLKVNNCMIYNSEVEFSMMNCMKLPSNCF